MNTNFIRLKINLISTMSRHNIRETSTSSFIYKKMKTVKFTKLNNSKSPKLCIYKLRKVLLLLSNRTFICMYNSLFIQLFNNSIIQIIIHISTNMKILNFTFTHKTRSIKSMTSSIFFSFTKLSMWNTIFFI